MAESSSEKGPRPLGWTLEALQRSLGLSPQATRDGVREVVVLSLGERLAPLIELGVVSTERIVILGGSPHVTAAVRMKGASLRRALADAGYHQHLEIRNG